jgi:methylmalonyl-CoA mutase N-terminal domain/subunit
LTHRLEAEAKSYIAKLDEMGGMVHAIEIGYPQMEIERAALAYQREIDSGERVIVGVNAFAEAEQEPVNILRIKPAVEQRQVRLLRQRKKQRSARRLRDALQRLERVSAENGYLLPPIMDAVRAEASVGEICDVFRRVYGEYRETGTL